MGSNAHRPTAGDPCMYLDSKAVDSYLLLLLHDADDPGIHDGPSPFQDVGQVQDPFRPGVARTLLPVDLLHFVEQDDVRLLTPPYFHRERLVYREDATRSEVGVGQRGVGCCYVVAGWQLRRRRGGAEVVGVEKDALSLGC